MTLRLFPHTFEFVSAATSWYLADLGELRDKQELFTHQYSARPQTGYHLIEKTIVSQPIFHNR